MKTITYYVKNLVFLKNCLNTGLQTSFFVCELINYPCPDTFARLTTKPREINY